jgi:hypothetical protein
VVNLLETLVGNKAALDLSGLDYIHNPGEGIIMNSKVTREQGVRIGINQAITYTTLVPILWFIGQPILVNALADDIKIAVQEQVAPMNAAFVALLQRDINGVRKSIAMLKFRQYQEDDWTSDDARELAELDIELEALREAMSALKVTP